MALLSRIYFNAVFGALGGLLGWLLYGAFGDKKPETKGLQDIQMLVGGALIGGLIGYFVVSVEAIRDASLARFARLGTYGFVLAAIGGAPGMLLGDYINEGVQASFGVNLFSLMLARGLGWTVLGITIGMSEGIAARSLGKFSYGMIGGALGGFVGGSLFALVYEPGGGSLSYWSGAIGLMILGACIGSLSALVKAVFQPASVKVMRGWQEGREYPLDKAASLLGRDEHADIALFRDMKVEKRHAFIKRVGERYLLVNNNAPPEQTRVNDAPVGQTQELTDGDRIQLGNVILRFQARAAINRARGKRPGPTPVALPSSAIRKM
ncbi:MAG TPA: FHA domain-containing protein [Gemmataceae bacterium]|nr:FHA domain-containing protein [Gemmataceae bacterium]